VMEVSKQQFQVAVFIQKVSETFNCDPEFLLDKWNALVPAPRPSLSLKEVRMRREEKESWRSKRREEEVPERKRSPKRKSEQEVYKPPQRRGLRYSNWENLTNAQKLELLDKEMDWIGKHRQENTTGIPDPSPFE